MLLQTNSYIVPKDKRAEHARLIRRFRQTLHRLGCDMFEVYEQVAQDWGSGETTGRYVQIMRFRDRQHQIAVQEAEHTDAAAQAIIKEFCDLINFPYQLQQGLFAVGFYSSALDAPLPPMAMADQGVAEEQTEEPPPVEYAPAEGEQPPSVEEHAAVETSEEPIETGEETPAEPIAETTDSSDEGEISDEDLLAELEPDDGHSATSDEQHRQ
jgi:hypothetical protein